MLNKKNFKKMSVVFVFFEKIFLSVKRKLIKKCDDDVLSRIKMCCKKIYIYYVENEKRGFYEKCLLE